ncbi:MAG: sugar ABC transporter permease [Trueperaceae bacterium]|nr:MAG: sugar ABC transporter permease [Trueperaceae bacterium]
MKPKSRRRNLRMWRDAFLLVTPFTLLYLIFFIFPTFRMVQLSFTNAPLVGSGEFNGLANYQRLINDWVFWKSLKNTGYFVLLTVVPNTAFGLMFALMVVRLKRIQSMVLAAFFLPFMLPVSVVTLTWQWLLDTQFGISQYVLRLFNEGKSIAVFNDPNWAMPVVAFVTIWWKVGFNMLLFIAGLQAISKEYYEAASLDGANNLQIFRHITWPLLWPITALVLTLQLIAQLKIFDQVYLLTGGGPFNSTIVVLQLMYREAFQNNRGGYASAIALVLFIVIMVASIIQYRVLRTGAAR